MQFVRKDMIFTVALSAFSAHQFVLEWRINSSYFVLLTEIHSAKQNKSNQYTIFSFKQMKPVKKVLFRLFGTKNTNFDFCRKTNTSG